MKTKSFGRQTGLTWVFDGRDPKVPEEIKLVFVPERGEHLRGAPASLFNRPGPGEDLVATIPVPRARKTTEATLAVKGRVSGGPILVPIKIQRPA